MRELRIPSLQHLARNWRSEPSSVARELVRLAKNPPRFSYSPLHGAVYDLFVLQLPYDQVVAGIKREKRESVRKILLSVLPLIRDHFDDEAPDYFQRVDRRYYPVGRGIMVPFDPPMIYGIGGQLNFPWFSFWRKNPLCRERASLFVTLVDEILMQDADLETARFQILDFSSVNSKSPRLLRITDANDIPRVSEPRKTQMLTTFIEGFLLAKDILSRQADSMTASKMDFASDPEQPGLFD